MAKVELKQPIVQEIASAVDGAKAAVLVQYLGLTVEQDTALRKELREAGVQYKVYKNTLMRRAFEGTEFEALSKHLDGPNAIAVSKDDPIIAEKILSKYAKNIKCFSLVGGVIEAGRDGKHPVERDPAQQTPRKHPGSDRELRACDQADRRERQCA